MITIEENDERFYIDSSTLPNAGYGLFAKVPIKAGDWLEVMGVMVKKGGVADTCTHYAKRYKFAGSKGDAKIVPMGYAGIVNHIDGERQNVEIRRIPGLNKRNVNSSEVVYYFIKDVEVGEEILGNYGEQVGEEVKKLVEASDYVEKNKKDWEEFLEFNLYDLRRLVEFG